MKRNQWLVLGGLGTVGVCMACILCLGLWVLLSARTASPQASPSNPVPAEEGLTYDEISRTAKSLTEIKRNEYYQSLIGTTIHWTGKVADVSATGELHLRIKTSIGYDVKIPGVPLTTAATYALGDRVTFDGDIAAIDDMFGSGAPIITVKYTALNKP